MNLDRMINMLLIKLSKKYKIFYMERRTYTENKIIKNFLINIDGETEMFNNKRQVLKYLSEEVM